MRAIEIIAKVHLKHKMILIVFLLSCRKVEFEVFSLSLNFYLTITVTCTYRI
jgi:hypothetical protein